METKPFEKVLSKKEVFRGALISVEHWEAEVFGGKRALREVVRHVGAAAVVALDENGFTTLVEQFRIAMGRTMLELPAGKKDAPDEDGLHCARRELREETGLTAGNWRLLTTIDTSPGFLTERIALYLATDLSQGDARPDGDECFRIVKLPLDEAAGLVMRGEITDAKTIVGLMMARRVNGGYAI